MTTTMGRWPFTRRCAALAIASWFATAGVNAQPHDQPPPPAPPRPLTIAAPQEGRLPNGVRVVVAERRGVPLVTARLLVLAGSELDPADKPGLVALTTGLLTRGTTRRSAPALASAAEALGGTLQTSSGWHQSGLGITVTTPRLSEAMALLVEAFRRPAFAQAEIDRLRSQTLDDLKVSRAQPGTVAGMVTRRLVYGEGRYGHSPVGTPASLGRLSRADVAGLHRVHFRPDQAVLVMAGDIDLATAMAMARNHLGDWRAAAPAKAPRGPAVGTLAATEVVAVDMPGSGQAAVVLALPAVPSRAPDRVAGLVTNSVLGSGYTSRLNQEIRIRRGLSYGVGSQLDARVEGGTLSIQVQTKNPSAAEVVDILHGELDRLATEPVGAEELEARKASLIGNFSRHLETTEGLAGEVASLVVDQLPPAELTQRIGQIQAVGPAEVRAFASRHFERRARRVVVAGEASAFEAALRVKAPGLVVWPLSKVE